MKILRINLFYKKGSTGKTVYNIHKELINQNHDSYVCYALGMHDEDNLFKFSSEFSWRFYTYISALTGMQYTYSYLETNRLLKHIKKINPDIVHIHVINCNTVNIYRLLSFLKNNKFNTVITFHAEHFYTGGCAHAYDCMKWKTGCGNCPILWDATHSLFFDFTHYSWKKFETIYSGFEERLKIVCVSDWLKERAELSPFFSKYDITVIENGTDTQNVFFPQHNEELHKKYKSDNKKVLLHVTPSFRNTIKGGEYILQLANRLDKNLFTFIIVGYDDNQDLPENIFTVKHLADQNLLAEYYSLADLTILTSKGETFSMVTAESLACGTPIIGFKCGAPERIALKDYSCFVENGNILELEQCVYDWKDKKASCENTLSEIAKIQYSKDKMTKEYIELYKSIL